MQRMKRGIDPRENEKKKRQEEFMMRQEGRNGPLFLEVEMGE